MRTFNITSEMVKGFTAEIEKNIEKIMSKNGFAIADFRATAKGGKVTELPDGEKRISITVSMLYPYTVCLGTGAKKTRVNIIFDADMKIISSCGNILNYVAWQLEYFNSYVEEVKKYGVDSITEQICPDLADTIEKYGFEWFEKKFAEFQQYLDSLVETKEEEKIDFAYMVEDFNDAIKEGVEAIFVEACADVVRFADSDMGEYISGSVDYNYDIEKMWAQYCFENGLMSANDAYDYYRANRDMFLDVDDLDEIVEGLDGTDDVGDGECLVWVKNPYYNSEDAVKNDAPCLDDVDMELAIERLADDIADRAAKTMGDYFVDVTRYMWDANDAIDEDRLRELLFDKVDGVADIDFAESDDAIVRIWFNRPIKKDVLVGEEQENALESAMNDGEDEFFDDVDRVVKVIKDYVINYEGLLMDYDGFTASMYVPWDIFNEDDMKMLIEDEMFKEWVYLRIPGIYYMLVYDDGVYVSVDVKKYNKVA